MKSDSSYPGSARLSGVSAAGATKPATTGSVAVWDPLVRIAHWSLVVGFIAAWLTADDRRDAHEIIGYAVAAVVLLRVLWGFVGSVPARFAGFVREPRAVYGYLRDIARGHPRRFLGHNPAGGAMIVLLLLSMALTALTGWMYTLDAFWAVTWVEQLHEIGAILMIFLVVAHVAGVIVASLSHHENLVASMWHGRKRAAEGDDVSAQSGLDRQSHRP